VLLIILIILSVLAYNKHKHFSTSGVTGSETITRLCEKISSKEDALKYFNEWLTKETSFSESDNYVHSIVKYKGYYEINLKTSIIINGRTTGYMGYSNYVVTKDGYLKGYYYIK
jgi:hypothetical protein